MSDEDNSPPEGAIHVARAQALANCRLEGLPVTPKLMAVYERYMKGEIDQDESFALLNIRRGFEFSMTVQLSSNSEEILLEALKQLHAYCPDARCCLDTRGGIGLKFVRQALRKNEAVEAAIMDISTALDFAEILDLRVD